MFWFTLTSLINLVSSCMRQRFPHKEAMIFGWACLLRTDAVSLVNNGPNVWFPPLDPTQADFDWFWKNSNQSVLVSCSRMIIGAPSTFSSADTALQIRPTVRDSFCASLSRFMNVRKKNVEKEDKCVSAQCWRHTKTVLWKCIFRFWKAHHTPKSPSKGYLLTFRNCISFFPGVQQDFVKRFLH